MVVEQSAWHGLEQCVRHRQLACCGGSMNEKQLHGLLGITGSACAHRGDRPTFAVLLPCRFL
jgi:hypothetical protein